MDYLRRLLLRSLAVPREHGSPVFDPFAQVIGWEFDGYAPAPQQESAVEPVRAAAPAPAPQRLEPVALPMQPSQAPAFDAAAADASEAVDPPAVAQLPPPASGTRAPPARNDNAGPAAPERVLLTQADAFMGSLGMKSVVVPEVPAPDQAMAAPSVPATRRHRASAPAPHTDKSGVPVLVQPAVPPASQQPGPQARLRGKPGPAKAATAPAAAAAPRSASPLAAPPQRMVQTTVVVAPSVRGLDDLAHSSGISRFGIGQS
ncbi:hypothetical protein Tamer19_61290 [Cupriavidus sp. TA19]|uniref:hypothetical protein n=1 Tax=unclassified Cupriavidus TaxID=2640874 RepID=UPI000E2F63DB|nr:MULTISPECIES: hypothetical protein [unclassified Cupriavidus]BDB28718.1 hypothetical protein CTP10_R61290 [Cupriavidus sp. P-10]GLC96720.1 hypothetical protein Tamer19_61290 [Cupriavidus sp. TA19]